jgi:hypothetical protein
VRKRRHEANRYLPDSGPGRFASAARLTIRQGGASLTSGSPQWTVPGILPSSAPCVLRRWPRLIRQRNLTASCHHNEIVLADSATLPTLREICNITGIARALS